MNGNQRDDKPCPALLKFVVYSLIREWEGEKVIELLLGWLEFGRKGATRKGGIGNDSRK